MTKLSLTLLGSFEISLDENRVSTFESDKVRALLAYLAIEAHKTHRREALCGLFWPDKPERLARRSLSQSLYNLRQAIRNDLTNPPYLHINQNDIQFNLASNQITDVRLLDRLAGEKSDAIENLHQIVDLYSGDLLKGISLRDSAPFEEWLLLKREYYNRIYIDALRQLVEIYRQRRECEQAIYYARRWVEDDPYQEDAHYLLIEMLAYVGRRSEAIAQFEHCSTMINDELGVEPTQKLTALMDTIRTGNVAQIIPGDLRTTRSSKPILAKPTMLYPLPVMIKDEPEIPLLAREQELARLAGHLKMMLRGQGQVVFVSGESGYGKSALVNEFCKQAQTLHGGLIIANGRCNAYCGVGDSFVPFRDILALLTGDGRVNQQPENLPAEQISRLWDLFPAVMQAIFEVAPDLLDNFIPAIPLFKRIADLPGGANWLQKMQFFTERSDGIKRTTNINKQLFTQYMALLERLAQQHPLILVLEDMHWADVDTIGLLFHIGTRIRHLPILIIGCYRPSEVESTHNHPTAEHHHSLFTVIDELKRVYGDIEISLRRDSDENFIEKYLDQFPNRFDDRFHQWLDLQTAGNPLFTIEFVNAMQEDGTMVADEHGRWYIRSMDMLSEGRVSLPARVEAVLDKRLQRLPFLLRNLLMIASVEGDTFTAEVVSQVMGIDISEVIHLLSGELSDSYRIVSAEGMSFKGLRPVCRYRFRQPVFRQFLYNRLDKVIRSFFHERVGAALEKIYSGKDEALVSISDRLAHHFQAIGLMDKAKYYWQMNKRATVSLLFYFIATGSFVQPLLDQIY